MRGCAIVRPRAHRRHTHPTDLHRLVESAYSPSRRKSLSRILPLMRISMRGLGLMLSLLRVRGRTRLGQRRLLVRLRGYVVSLSFSFFV